MDFFELHRHDLEHSVRVPPRDFLPGRVLNIFLGQFPHERPGRRGPNVGRSFQIQGCLDIEPRSDEGNHRVTQAGFVFRDGRFDQMAIRIDGEVAEERPAEVPEGDCPQTAVVPGIDDDALWHWQVSECESFEPPRRNDRGAAPADRLVLTNGTHSRESGEERTLRFRSFDLSIRKGPKK